MKTRLEELRDDPEALEILKEDLPNAWEMIQGGNAEFLSLDLDTLQTMFFRGFNPEMVQQGTRRLLTLKAF